MTQKAIALGEIHANKDNRTYDAKGLKSLARSIESHGLLQPLAVRKDDKGYTLIDGHRRFAAIGLLQRAKKKIEGEAVTGKYGIACKVLDPDVADAELMIAANNEREAVHWSDSARAMRKALIEGTTVEQIADRFNYSVRSCEQYLAIGNLPEAFLELGRADKIDLAVAKALTLCPPDLLKKLLPEAKKGQLQAWTVKRMMSEVAFAVARALPGVKAEYIKQGGVIARDLFAGKPGEDDDEGEGDYFANKELALKLQGEAALHIVEKAAHKYATAAIVSREDMQKVRVDYNGVEDKKRLSYFLVAEGDGSYRERIEYVLANDPKAKQAKDKKKGKDKAGVNTAGGADPDTTLTKAAMSLMNTHRTARVRLALMTAPFRMALELALVGLLMRNGSTVKLTREHVGHPEAASIFSKEKILAAENKSVLTGSMAIGANIFASHAEDDEVDVYRTVKALDDDELRLTFQTVVARLIDNPDNDRPMSNDSLFAELAADLRQENGSYIIDRLYLEGVRSKGRLAEIAKLVGVEAGATRAETVERILKAPQAGVTATPDSEFTPPAQPKAKKKAA